MWDCQCIESHLWAIALYIPHEPDRLQTDLKPSLKPQDLSGPAVALHWIQEPAVILLLCVTMAAEERCQAMYHLIFLYELQVKRLCRFFLSSHQIVVYLCSIFHQPLYTHLVKVDLQLWWSIYFCQLKPYLENATWKTEVRQAFRLTPVLPVWAWAYSIGVMLLAHFLWVMHIPLLRHLNTLKLKTKTI